MSDTVLRQNNPDTRVVDRVTDPQKSRTAMYPENKVT